MRTEIYIFFENDIIFFDNKGTILSFDNKSKMVMEKKLFIPKSEKKLKSIFIVNESQINSKF